MQVLMWNHLDVFPSLPEASPPGAEGEELNRWEGEERQGKDVIGCGLERQWRARSGWAWMVTDITKDLDYMLRLGAISEV